jgi:very-short-patch-repair endonuclease
MNAKLPIPFGPSGTMEVDFFCPEAKLAVEIDGSQHLGDAEAWRRDRHKDRLLQQHGIFILRFLAADIVKDLDAILDAILMLLDHRHREQARAGPET